MTLANTRPARLLLALAVGLVLAKAVLPAGLIRPPEWLVLPFAGWINAVFSFQTWRLLRHDQQLPVETASAVVKRLVEAMLADFGDA